MTAVSLSPSEHATFLQNLKRNWKGRGWNTLFKNTQRDLLPGDSRLLNHPLSTAGGKNRLLTKTWSLPRLLGPGHSHAPCHTTLLETIPRRKSPQAPVKLQRECGGAKASRPTQGRGSRSPPGARAAAPGPRGDARRGRVNPRARGRGETAPSRRATR